MNLRDLSRDLLTLRAIARRGRPACGPRILQLNISDDCNLACAICNRAGMGVSGLLDADRAIALVDELREMGTQEVYYHGFGEPGLHPRLPDMIRHVRAHAPGMRQHLITNGAWSSPELLRAVDDGRVGVRFSLHAGDDATWQRLHPRDSLELFERAGSNLQHVAGRAPDRVEALFVICNANLDGIPRMAAYAADHGVRRILFRPMRLFTDASGRYMNAHLMPTAEQFRAAAEAVARCRTALRGRIAVRAEAFDRHAFDPAAGRPSSRAFYLSRSCYIGYVLTVVERDGRVWGCLPESSGGEPLGDIRASSFREIWHGPRYEAFRRRQLFLDKKALDQRGCHTYCQHLDTNVRLNRLVWWRQSPTTATDPGAGP